MRAGGMGRRRITENAVTLLPQPDSPTTPSVSPASMARSTPSTACTMPSYVAKWVRSPRISSKRSIIARLHYFPRIEGIAQPITDVVDRQHREKDRDSRNQRPVRRDVQRILGVEQDAAPGRDVGREPES